MPFFLNRKGLLLCLCGGKRHPRPEYAATGPVGLSFSFMSALSFAALQKLLEVVIPCFVENVRAEHERQVVMCILETMNNIIKFCKEEAFTKPAYLQEVSHLIRDVLKKKVSA